MRRSTTFWLAAAAMLAVGPETRGASAWDGWARGYSPAYYGSPVHTASPPAVIYPGPPVYAFSYGPSADGTHGGRLASTRTFHSGYYTARINPFRGSRWDYSAAYYNSPVVHRAAARGRPGRRGWGYRLCPRYRAYIRGPIVPTAPRRW
jgi:hypothetical protein